MSSVGFVFFSLLPRVARNGIQGKHLRYPRYSFVKQWLLQWQLFGVLAVIVMSTVCAYIILLAFAVAVCTSSSADVTISKSTKYKYPSAVANVPV